MQNIIITDIVLGVFTREIIYYAILWLCVCIFAYLYRINNSLSFSFYFARTLVICNIAKINWLIFLMKYLCIYYIPLFAVRLQIAQWYDGIIPSHESMLNLYIYRIFIIKKTLMLVFNRMNKNFFWFLYQIKKLSIFLLYLENGPGVFMLTVITDILLYILIRHTPTLIGKKNLFYNALLFHSTSFVSFAALSRPLSHAWITFLLVSIKIFSLYRMNFFMMLFIAIGMLVPFHNQTLLFTIMCWPLCIKQWILSTKYDQYENQRKKLINCCLLIILSVYTYINSKPTRIETWILPPWMLYYNLYFILYELSEPFKTMGKTVKEIYHCRETYQLFSKRK